MKPRAPLLAELARRRRALRCGSSDLLSRLADAELEVLRNLAVARDKGVLSADGERQAQALLETAASRSPADVERLNAEHLELHERDRGRYWDLIGEALDAQRTTGAKLDYESIRLQATQETLEEARPGTA